MTRGTLVMIADDGIYSSIEFNGDMYLEGYGMDAISVLEEVDEVDFTFDDAVRKFDDEHHKYRDEEMTYMKKGKSREEFLDMSKDYFDNWFSDYLFVKNMTDDPVVWKDSKGFEHTIEPDRINVLYFGNKVPVNYENMDDYISLKESFNDIANEDVDAIMEAGLANRVCGIYDDTYDVGYSYANEVYGIPDWFANDRYINFEAIGEDAIENDDWFKLPSGKYAHLS